MSSCFGNSAEKERIAYNLLNRAKERDAKSHNVLSGVGSSDAPNWNDDTIYLDAHSLQDLVSSGKTTYDAITKERILRTRLVGKDILNAVTEELYDEAMAGAEAASALSKDKRHELTGIPVSIKDCFEQAGTDSTCGSAARAFQPYLADGLLVKALRGAHALPFVRSNVPQLMMMPESENALWGRTNNPWDLTRNPGGSSGGEAALIAAGCSVLGLGSDIGGSIRIPSHFCGIAGFKPTPRRLSKQGNVMPRVNGVSGQTIIEATAGPMARSVRDCVAMMDALLAPSILESDPELMSKPLNKSICESGLGRKLKIAYFLDDGWFTPVQTCQRAVTESVEALKKRGHEVVPFSLKDFGKEVYLTYIKLMGADGNWYSFMKALGSEELHETYRSLHLFTEIPNWLRPAIAQILRLTGETRKAEMLLSQKNGGLDVREYYDSIIVKALLERKFKEVFESEKYDAIVFPALGIPSPRHGDVAMLLSSLSYSFLANLLHWPAGVVPVTLVAEGEDDYDISKLPENQRDSISRLTKENMVGSKGLPVGVQVMTRKWQDELCLFVMAEIEKEVQFNARPNIAH